DDRAAGAERIFEDVNRSTSRPQARISSVDRALPSKWSKAVSATCASDFAAQRWLGLSRERNQHEIQRHDFSSGGAQKGMGVRHGAPFATLPSCSNSSCPMVSDSYAPNDSDCLRLGSAVSTAGHDRSCSKRCPPEDCSNFYR